VPPFSSSGLSVEDGSHRSKAIAARCLFAPKPVGRVFVGRHLPLAIDEIGKANAEVNQAENSMSEVDLIRTIFEGKWRVDVLQRIGEGSQRLSRLERLILIGKARIAPNPRGKTATPTGRDRQRKWALQSHPKYRRFDWNFASPDPPYSSKRLASK
jgi:hypothetical protein